MDFWLRKPISATTAPCKWNLPTTIYINTQPTTWTRSVAQRAQRERERQQRTLQDGVNPPPPSTQRSFAVVQWERQERERLQRLSDGSLPPTPPSNPDQSDARSVAQQERRDREYLQRLLDDSPPPTPPILPQITGLGAVGI